MIEEKTRANAGARDSARDDNENILLNVLKETSGKPLPKTYKVGRDASIILAKTNKELFAGTGERNSGNFMVGGLGSEISGYDFEAFKMAFAHILYNQSYQSGNVKENSGISKERARELSKKSDREYFRGEVITSLNDLCRLAYGVDEPSIKQKRDMETLIDTLNKQDFKITFPNGDTLEAPLLWREKLTRKGDGAKILHIMGHPIFCNNVASNFAEFPQDITKELSKAVKRKTTAHYRLIQFLGRQDKRKPVSCNISTLLDEIGIDKGQYKEHPARAEKQLLALFDDMIKIRLLSTYITETTSARGRNALSKVKFVLNQDYLRETSKGE